MLNYNIFADGMRVLCAVFEGESNEMILSVTTRC